MDKPVDDKTLRRYYMDAFGTESGQMVLKDLANRCFKYSSTCEFNHATGKYPDTDEVMTNEGRRQVLLHIESMMSPEGISNLAQPEEGSE